jgi:hypothetical protein
LVGGSSSETFQPAEFGRTYGVATESSLSMPRTGQLVGSYRVAAETDQALALLPPGASFEPDPQTPLRHP